jgi:metal-dependent amidase/aminoacylase/carboxypeptidase family protein
MVRSSAIQAAAGANADEAVKLSEKLFDYAEMPYHELKSSKAMAELLKKAGFEVEYPFFQQELGYGSAFRATLKNGAEPKVAFLAEYDALAGIGHGCGHNLHGPLPVLAAARKFLDLVDARRECFTRDVRFNTTLQEGGKAPNIIPGYAKIRLEFRTDSRGKLKEKDRIIRSCAGGAALAMDCRVTFTPGLLDLDDMVRVKSLEAEVSRLLEENGEKAGEALPASGSSDLGNVSYRCPAIQPLISITDEPYALHTEQLRDATKLPKAHQAMEHGACVLAELAMRVLDDADFRAAVRSGFQQALKAKS